MNKTRPRLTWKRRFGLLFRRFSLSKLWGHKQEKLKGSNLAQYKLTKESVPSSLTKKELSNPKQDKPVGNSVLEWKKASCSSCGWPSYHRGKERERFFFCFPVIVSKKLLSLQVMQQKYFLAFFCSY
jgi:ribosomal protein L37E